jgi:hypothetical protein
MSDTPDAADPALLALAAVRSVPGVVDLYPVGRLDRLRRQLGDARPDGDDLIKLDRRRSGTRVTVNVGVAAQSSAASVAQDVRAALRAALALDDDARLTVRISRVID